MKKIFFSIASLCLSACATTPSSTPAARRELPTVLESVGLSASLSRPYIVSEQADATSDKIRVRNWIARARDGRIMRIEKLDGADPVQGDNFIRDKIAQLTSIYEPNRDPYFSVLTRETTCPERFKPVQETRKRHGAELQVLCLYANDRLTYGACTDDQAAYRVLVGMQRCPGNEGLFVVESFVPVKQFSENDVSELQSVDCRQP